MKKKIYAIGVLALLTFAVLAVAANEPDITGKWIAKDGKTEIRLDLKTDGDKVTGTYHDPRLGKPADIIGGKIEGDNISFHYAVSDCPDIKLELKGKIDGDKITFAQAIVYPMAFSCFVDLKTVGAQSMALHMAGFTAAKLKE